ncbi:LysR family transcriptional regulator [Pararobbsia silviterrae]|uniref:LysR family transcriptional regulator n=1 Tax=Pararobbsia silviterrae TaxID=1792498 RepID=A0A494XZ76_9BURK|nr:LysR family transcriptional regulator [Pararobbsia silviterrae]
MDRLQAMQVFTRVVETNSFSRAADTLNLPRPTVSTVIQSLEAHLGVRLLQRTTRRLNLTPDGAAYYERCVRILSDIEETEAAFSHATTGPRGKLRVDMPGALGRMIVMPRIHEFHARFPQVDVMIGIGDRNVDLVQDGIDLAIRIGTLSDSSLVARRLGLYQRLTVASPMYLERHGRPETIDDLHDHVAVNYFFSRTGRLMDFAFWIDGHRVELKMRSALAVNDAEAHIAAVLNGIGIAQSGHFMSYGHVEAGRLVELFPEHRHRPVPISAVYPHNRHLSPTVRVFVDWMAEIFEQSPLINYGLSDVPTAPARDAAGDTVAQEDV